ncbi:MAG: PhoPQ-activated protein PqaA family protein [Planctomycetota bacterium]|nr:PhoPQ-activated protein PqaA family protein [Planctomycetota bacterium]MDA1105828.1 PhoPQ-activated protein PqaA family protein [Planctomycetota bacterium]
MSITTLALAFSLAAAAPNAGPPIEPDASVAGLVDRYMLSQRAFAGATLVQDDQGPDGRLIRWDLTSQFVDGAPWHHELTLVIPEGAEPDCVVWMPPPGAADLARLRSAAGVLHVSVAMLAGVPPAGAEGAPQGSAAEAAAVAASLRAFRESGDPDRPLPIAMARAAIAAMDTIESWSEDELPGAAIRRFLLVGGGVRGWGAWLAAGLDTRVVGTMLAGFDLANLAMQRADAHPLLAGAGPFDDARGAQLTGLVDPLVIAARARSPLWIVRGTTDTAQPLDALEVYAWDLRQPFRPSLRFNRGAEVACELPVDELRWLVKWSHDPAIVLPGGSLALSTTAVTLVPEVDSGDINKVRLWSASSATLDFSGATWTGEPMARDAHQWLVARPALREGAQYQALVGELILASDSGEQGSITTVPVIIRGASPRPPSKGRLFVPPVPKPQSTDDIPGT